MRTSFPASSGHSCPHQIMISRLIIDLTCAFASRPPRRAPSVRRRSVYRCNEPQKMCTTPALVDALATNLKKCADGGPRHDPQLAGCGNGRRVPVESFGAPARNPRAPQEAGTRRARAACGSARGARMLLEPRASGGVRDGTRCATPAHQRDGDLRARARRRKAISRTFFSVCCAIADRFEPFRGYSGRLQVLLLYKLFHPRSSDLRFSLGEAGGGASRARLSPQQTAKNVLLEVSAAARGMRAGRDLGGCRRTRLQLANLQAPAGRSRLQLATSRTKPAPIAAGWGRRRARDASGWDVPATEAPGDLWRFRKAT